MTRSQFIVPPQGDADSASKREIRTWQVVGDDDTKLVVVESRFERVTVTSQGPRLMIGATRWMLNDGSHVRPCGIYCFESVESGEILTITGSPRSSPGNAG